jgi:galactokinase
VIDLERLRTEFTARYHREPRIFRAPGRVNLIGEHTDYNDGFVFPAALDFAAYVAAAPREDRVINAASMDYEGELSLSLDEERGPEKSWTKYVQGVAVTLERHGRRSSGADLLITSDVPGGAGLSSSAALTTAIGFAIMSLSGEEVDRELIARVGQETEHNFAGVRTGIMDQFVSAFGQAEHAIFLDCRDLSWSAVPLNGASILICNTETKHDLAESEYNKRREECEEAASILGKTSLRDLTLDELEDRKGELSDVIYRRALHVVSENERVQRSVAALRAGDLTTFGRLINESHESLRKNYEVSSPELDIMVDLARSHEGVLGARMTGGGFGGCTVNLLTPGGHSDFVSFVTEGYERATGIRPEIYECRITNGANEVM